MGISLGKQQRTEVTKPSANPRPGDGHELIETNDRGLFKPSLAELSMNGRDQDVAGRQRSLRDNGREVRNDKIRSTGFWGEDDRWAVLHRRQIGERKRDEDQIPSCGAGASNGFPVVGG